MERCMALHSLIAPLLLTASLCAHGDSERFESGSPATVGRPARIQWFGTLQQGLAEAERTGRPILLSAATLRCEGVPGKW